MRWDESSHGLHRLARRLITPQLMRKTVRKRILGTKGDAA
jgi:hypothetical protein